MCFRESQVKFSKDNSPNCGLDKLICIEIALNYHNK